MVDPGSVADRLQASLMTGLVALLAAAGMWALTREQHQATREQHVRLVVLPYNAAQQGERREPAASKQGRPFGDPNLFGQVGELPAGGRLDVRRIQGGAKLVLADAQLRDRAAEL
jgi:hypothetical protein